ncbi:MAG: lipoyl(octanoyl) transferase LipB [Pseudomonadota bacterium]
MEHSLHFSCASATGRATSVGPVGRGEPDPAGIVLRERGRTEYLAAWQAMRAWTAVRDPAAADELWLTEHPPVYTLGQGGREVHVRAPGDIPVVRCDRGGQVTYHGPGQAVLYVLVDLRRRALGVRPMVRLLERCVIDWLAQQGVEARGREDAPGVYVGEAKVAALGLKVSRGCTYHGLALNVDLDLEPFGRIDPCGYPGQPVTRTRDLGIHADTGTAGRGLAATLSRLLRAHPPTDVLPPPQA